METIVAIFGQRAQKLLSPKIVQNVVSSVSKQMETLFAFASEYLSKGQNPPISSLK